MEEILKKIGISEKTISQMEEMCPEIKELNDEDVLQKIEILKSINCNDVQIRNIISSNAMYLDRSNTDINKLINQLTELFPAHKLVLLVKKIKKKQEKQKNNYNNNKNNNHKRRSI